MPDSPVTPARLEPPTSSIHRQLLIGATPQWLIGSTAPRRAALKHADTSLPPAYWRATPEQRQQLLMAGLDDYLSKPASEQQLLNMMEKWHKPENLPINTAKRVAQDSVNIRKLAVDSPAYRMDLLKPAQ